MYLLGGVVDSLTGRHFGLSFCKSPSFSIAIGQYGPWFGASRRDRLLRVTQLVSWHLRQRRGWVTQLVSWHPKLRTQNRSWRRVEVTQLVSWHLKDTIWLRRVRRRVLRARVIAEVFYMVFAGIGPGE